MSVRDLPSIQEVNLKKAKLMNRKRKVVTWECLDLMKNAAQQPNFYFHLLWRLNSLLLDLFSKGPASNVIATVWCTWATKHWWSYCKTHAMVWLRHLDHISPWRGRRGAHTNPVTGGHQQPQQPECQPGSTHSVTMEENCWSRFKSHTSRWPLPESRMDEGGCSSQRCLQSERSTGSDGTFLMHLRNLPNQTSDLRCAEFQHRKDKSLWKQHCFW